MKRLPNCSTLGATLGQVTPAADQLEPERLAISGANEADHVGVDVAPAPGQDRVIGDDAGRIIQRELDHARILGRAGGLSQGPGRVGG